MLVVVHIANKMSTCSTTKNPSSDKLICCFSCAILPLTCL